MKLTYLTWGYSYDTVILQTFQEAGLVVNIVELPQKLLLSEEENHKICKKQEEIKNDGDDCFIEQIRISGGDIVFSINFFSVVSDFCEKEKIPYCSWILQLPNFDLYTSAVRNTCNYLGVCDSYLVEKLWQIGVSKAFFLPNAVELNKPESIPVEREVCFIAKQPEDILNTTGMSVYGKGYLDAVLHAQRVLYGAYILENGLLSRVQQEFLANHPISTDIIPQMQKLFIADYYFAPVCTRIQQTIFLQNFASIMTIYSNGDFANCESEKRPFIEDETERRKVYAGKEFSLVLAPHALHNGIPRETLEVIAAGGFPVVGFQRDYAYFFKKDENLVYFTNPAEFSQAIVRYGNSIEERERVKEAAYQVLLEGHTYQHRIITMLEMWKKL